MSSISHSNAAPGIKSGERFLSIGDVLEKTSFRSKSSIYDLERAGAFPSRIPLFCRRVAWLESEVEAWMASRVALRNPSEKDKNDDHPEV